VKDREQILHHPNTPFNQASKRADVGICGLPVLVRCAFNPPVSIVDKASWRVVKFNFEVGLRLPQVIRGTFITKVRSCRNSGREED
jgi:hypothetical protein